MFVVFAFNTQGERRYSNAKRVGEMIGVIPLFCHIFDGSTWYLRYWLHGFELGMHGTWFREFRVPGFESTWYMVSELRGT